uniref:Uncharacterized protein n=1 Tax=Macaca fascicularis TaxID=9541 RepID=A0A7N9D215_MACFA
MYVCMFLLRWGLTPSPRLEYNGVVSAHRNLPLPGSSNYSASASQVVGSRGSHHHAWLIFLFFIDKGFCHVGQAALELPNSGDPPILASQSAGITGVQDQSGQRGKTLPILKIKNEPGVVAGAYNPSYSGG